MISQNNVIKAFGFFCLVFLLPCFLVSCEENDPKGFNGEDAVYFQADAGNWSNVTDSVTYSFAGKNSKKDVVELLVNLMGYPADHDRTFKVMVNQELTTAKEGIHYEALKSEYTLKSGEMQAVIPVTVMNTDEGLKEKTVQLVVSLLPTDELGLGISSRTTIRIIISNVLTKPSYWDRYSMTYYFGSYSRSKHEMFIQILGRNFPPSASEMSASWSYWQDASTYLNNYFTEHYPVVGSDGKVIEPWK